MTGRRRAALILAVLGLALAACGSDDSTPSEGADRPPEAATGSQTGTVRVLAASSLTEAFTDIAAQYEKANAGVDVQLSFAASSAIVEQVKAGAPVDVVATADEATMASLVAAELVGSPTVLARNALAIAVERGNPKGIKTLADLGQAGLVVVTCAPQVPCGKLAAAAFAKAGLTIEPASREENVKAVVAKVALGEADAGIVYRTDVRIAGKVEGVEIADDPALQAVYPVAITEDSGAAASAFAEFLTGPEAGAVFARQFFLPPS